MSQGDASPADSDWMSSFGSTEEAPQAEAELDWMSQGDPAPADSDWMSSFGGTEEAPQAEADLDWMSQDEPTPVDANWMSQPSVERDRGSITGQLPDFEAGIDARDILQRTIQANEQPDWLSDLTKEMDVADDYASPTPALATIGTMGETEAAAADWLLDDEDFGFEDSPSEDESPAWLESSAPSPAMSAPPAPDVLPEEALPSWMSAFNSQDEGIVAQGPVLTDNSNDAPPASSDEVPPFDFIYDFELKPAWMRGKADSDADGFTPPWMR
jgi:hypothetical protein